VIHHLLLSTNGAESTTGPWFALSRATKNVGYIL